MSSDRDRREGGRSSRERDGNGPRTLTPGKFTNTELLGSGAAGPTTGVPGRRSATETLEEVGTPGKLPYLQTIQAAFGRHDVSGIDVSFSSRAAETGAKAYAKGNLIEFSGAPDLHTVAHEAAHVVQQRFGGGMMKGAGRLDDEHEKHADRIADAVVAGQSVEALLDERARGGGQAVEVVQKKPQEPSVNARDYLQYHHPFKIQEELKLAIEKIGMIANGPYGDKLTSKTYATNVLDVIYENTVLGAYGKVGGYMFDGLMRFVAPESLEAIIDRSRGHDWDNTDPDHPVQKTTGPVSPTYITPVAIEITNAIARRYVKAIEKHFPAFVRAYIDWQEFNEATGLGGGDHPMQESWAPLLPEHPMEMAVIHGLFGAQSEIPLAQLMKERPDLVEELKEKYKRQRTTPIPGKGIELAMDMPKDRPTKIKFRGAEGLFHWFEAIPDGEPGERTAAEVAKALFVYADRQHDTASAEAYRLTPVPPLWGFHGEDIRIFKPEHKEQLRQVMAASQHLDWPLDMLPVFNFDIMYFKPPVIDPIAELSADPKAAVDRAKLAQKTPTANKDEASLVSKLTENLKLIDAIASYCNVVSADVTALNVAQGRINDRFKATTTTSPPNVEGEYALAEQQGTALATIATGMNDITVKYQMYSQIDEDNPDGVCDPSIRKMDPETRKLLDDCIEPFTNAIAAIEFPEVALQRAELGSQRVQAFEISVQEMQLHSANTQIDAQLDPDSKANPADVHGKDNKVQSDQLAYDLGGLRIKLASDPAHARLDVTKKGDQVGDFVFDVSIQDKLLRMTQLWDWINKEDDFWEGLGDKLKGEALKLKGQALYQRFITDVRDPFKTAQAKNDEPGKRAAREAFQKLMDEYIPYANEVQSFITDTESHKKWAKIIAAIAIAIVAFALGQWYFAGILAAGGTLFEAAVVGGIVTTTTSMVLEKLILNKDPTLGSIITGFVGNIAMFGIVGKLAMAAKAAGVGAEATEATIGAARATADVEKAAVAGEAAQGAAQTSKAAKLIGFTKEIVIGEAVMLVQSETQTLIDEHRMMTSAELEETLAMGVVNIIGMKVGQHVFDTTVDGFKAMRAARGVDIQGLMDMRAALHEQGNTLMEAAGGQGKLKKGAPAPRAQAQKLLEQWQRYFEKEREVVEKLTELAEKNPQAFRGKMAELEQARETAAGDAELSRQFRQARALLGVEEIGPNLYRGDPAAFDALLAQHKSAGSELVSITTDPRTGQRSLKVKTSEGIPFEIIEKLPDVGERKAPTVSVGQARFFEDWLSKIDTTTPEGAQVHQRLLEYYARDPQAAMKLAADHYKFTPGEAPTPELIVRPDAPAEAPKPTDKGKHDAKADKPVSPQDQAAADAGRAFEHYEYTRENLPKDPARTDKAAMNRGDFEAMYKAGFEFDPVKGEFVVRKSGTPAAQLGHTSPALAGDGTHVLGEVHSEAVGHELMRKLVSGDAEALRVVGLEPPPDFDSRTSEWGLGRDTKTNRVVLIRGGKGAVDWSLLPGVEDIAHSHPYVDPVTGKPRRLKGMNGDGVIDVNQLKAGASDKVLMDLLYLMPSTGDLRFVSLGGRGGHRVHTPYVSLGEGKIGNPVEGGLQPTVEIVINKAEPVGLLSPESTIVVYKGELTLYAGDTPIKTIEIWQRYHAEGSFAMDWVTLEPPQGMTNGLPADHPIAKFQSTPAATKPVGKVPPETITKLVSQGFPDPEQNPALKKALEGVSDDQAKTLDAMALNDKMVGFDNWLKRVNENPKQIGAALKDLEAARQALLEDGDREITFDKAGKPDWEGKPAEPAPKGKGAKAKGAGEVDPALAAKRAKRLDDAAEQTRGTLQNAFGVDPDAWIGRMKAAFGDANQGTRFFAKFQHAPDPAALAMACDRLLSAPKIPADMRAGLLEHAADPHVDGVQYIDDAIALSNRQLSDQAIATLLRLSKSKLDLEWLKQTQLTDPQLEQLGQRDNLPWNKFEELADAKRDGTLDTSAAIKASKASQPHLRGLAAEVVAQRTKLPGDFTIEGPGKKQGDGLEPDFELRGPKGEIGELEVKGNSPDDVREMVSAAEQAQEQHPGVPLESINQGGFKGDANALQKAQRLVKQLRGTKQRGHTSMLGISGELTKPTRSRLMQLLEEEGVTPNHVVSLSEADIKAEARKMRENMGLPEPFEKSGNNE